MQSVKAKLTRFRDGGGKNVRDLEHIPLTKPVTTIGRSAECDIIIQDDEGEPTHCLITNEGNGFVLSDLSTNQSGTAVSGKGSEGERTFTQVIRSDYRLREGDVLKIGSAILMYSESAADPSSDAGTQRRSGRLRRIFWGGACLYCGLSFMFKLITLLWICLKGPFHTGPFEHMPKGEQILSLVEELFLTGFFGAIAFSLFKKSSR